MAERWDKGRCTDSGHVASPESERGVRDGRPPGVFFVEGAENNRSRGVDQRRPHEHEREQSDD